MNAAIRPRLEHMHNPIEAQTQTQSDRGLHIHNFELMLTTCQ